MTRSTISFVSRSVVAVGLLSTVALGSGCGQIIEGAVDEVFEESTPGLRGPLDARIRTAPELDPARVRVALLRWESAARVELEDGEGGMQGVRVHASTANDGRVRLIDQWTQTAEGEYDEERFGGVASIEPFELLEDGVRAATDDLSIGFPRTPGTTSTGSSCGTTTTTTACSS